MISPTFNISEFFESITEKNYLETILAAQSEVTAAETLTAGGRRGAPAARQQGAGHYADVLKKFLFLLNTGAKPGGVDDNDFARFRPFIARFVRDGILRAEALDVFKKQQK